MLHTGVDVNLARDHDNNNLLAVALKENYGYRKNIDEEAGYQQEYVIQYLLKAKIDINHKNSDGFTPISYLHKLIPNLRDNRSWYEPIKTRLIGSFEALLNTLLDIENFKENMNAICHGHSPKLRTLLMLCCNVCFCFFLSNFCFIKTCFYMR